MVATAADGSQADRPTPSTTATASGASGRPRTPAVGDCFSSGCPTPCHRARWRSASSARSRASASTPAIRRCVWEAWDGERWVGCEVDSDGTGGFNQTGDVVLHVPPGTGPVAAISLRGRRLAALPGGAGRSGGSRPTRPRPASTKVAAFTSGGTIEAVNAEVVTDEIVGEAEGVPAQRFLLRSRPVVPGEPPSTT